MASQRRFAGIAHNIAQHAQSSLSFLRPHLANACRTVDRPTVVVELIAAAPYPEGLPPDARLAEALSHVRDQLFDITRKHSLDPVHIASATLTFAFADDYSQVEVAAVLRTLKGRSYASVVPGILASYPRTPPARRRSRPGGAPNWIRDVLDRIWPG